MPTFYDSVGVEPTYELAENIIKATIQNLKHAIDYSNILPTEPEYTKRSMERLGYRCISRFTVNKHETLNALQIIINHFPDILIKGDNSLRIKNSSKHLLNANDLLIMDYYYLLLSEYEERVNKHQQYIKKQQDRQRNKLLLVLLVPFIMITCMFLVGD